MNNVATPTVSAPIMNFQGLTLPSSEIPKVSCVADASRYPSKPNSQDVLLDQNDPEIAYFRLIDSNGFVQVDRRRCVAEPEPTIEEINDRKYMSKADFEAFREEMRENVRVLTAAITAATNTNKQSYKPYNKPRGSAVPNNQESDAATKTGEQS